MATLGNSSNHLKCVGLVSSSATTTTRNRCLHTAAGAYLRRSNGYHQAPNLFHVYQRQDFPRRQRPCLFVSTAGGGSTIEDIQASSSPSSSAVAAAVETTEISHTVRLSKLLSQHSEKLAISRREAERLIQSGQVTVAGSVILSPHYLVDWKDLQGSAGVVQVKGKAVALVSPLDHQNKNSTKNNNNNNNNDVKVWIVHKLKGEVVSEHDPQGRPSMLERLVRSGVGKFGIKTRHHLKPIGRLDLSTEGLILVTNCGHYARDMELPSHKFHRTYRVRVHGHLTQYKVQAIQRGISIPNTNSAADTGGGGGGPPVRYSPMKVELEGNKRGRLTATNCWVRITCTEGKNRQIRNVLKHLGLSVTRLIRTSFGDYQLQTIPPGMALEVPVKDLNKQLHKGPLFSKTKRHKKPGLSKGQSSGDQSSQQQDEAPPVQWVRHYR